MSRSYSDDYDGESFNNEWAFYQANAERALRGKRGRKALADLREALLALPEPRLIANAFSTFGEEPADLGSAPPPRWNEPGFDFATYQAHRDGAERNELLAEQGAGVCSVAAYVWHQRVKAGADPQQALVDLPLLPDYDGDGYQTEEQGVQAGLSRYLAWTLMSRNDDTYDSLTPEGRWQAVMHWIDERLAEPSSTGAKGSLDHTLDDDCPKTHLRSLIDGEQIVVHEPVEKGSDHA